MEPTSSSPAAAQPSLRVLRRPSQPSSTPAPVPNPTENPASNPVHNPTSNPTHKPSPPSQPPDAVVVVGFIGSSFSTDVKSLANRIIDAKVFGSGGLDMELLDVRRNDAELNQWFRHRNITYYYDQERGIVFLQFSSSLSAHSLLARCQTDAHGRPSNLLEEYEAEDLRGMLFIFSVCHVVLLLHEGLRFDIQILKKFRMLQAAKHSLSPFIKDQITPILTPKSSSSSSSIVQQPSSSRTASISPPGRRGSSMNRHASAISFMSGSSHPSALPGQCVPVLLVVFVDDLESYNHCFAPHVEDSTDASSVNRPSSKHKEPSSVVVLARPSNRTEGSFRKKLHSSLEAQIRFLIKKCRTLVGAEGQIGARGAGNLSPLPLFALDPTRVVVLVDRSMNRRSEPLDFVSGIVEEALNSGVVPYSHLLQCDGQSFNGEDTQLIKDFIYRQSDNLRGKGGLPSNAASGTVAGVGMVAAAIAAAAASAAAGKSVSAPQLPSMKKWLLSCTAILHALLSPKYDPLSESVDISELSSRNDTKVNVDHSLQPRTAAIKAAISCLESSMGLNMKFSITWCQRALPAAKEVYLKDLPTCYPTSLHKKQLEKALQAFNSMVKGPAVKVFAKKLEEECTSVWESGRQLCDAVSLTGKPCMHKRHADNSSHSSHETKQHSSGYCFLHACACGRSRRLREDPFDFETANVVFSCFNNCETLLPTLIFPKGNNVGSLPSNSWSIVRVGGAKYYKPSKGLLQVGFAPAEKFLLKWTMPFLNKKQDGSLHGSMSDKSSESSSIQATTFAANADGAVEKSDSAPGLTPIAPKKSSAAASADSVISFGKGLPSFNMKKPFSEVVAASVVHSAGSVRHKRQPAKANAEKGGIPLHSFDHMGDGVHVADERQQPKKVGHRSAHEVSQGLGTKNSIGVDPFLQIGSNIVPVNISKERKAQTNVLLKQTIVYIGFEHECAHGHRFLLTPEHLKGIPSAYPHAGKCQSHVEDTDIKHLEPKPNIDEKGSTGSRPTISETINRQQNGRLTAYSRSSSEMRQAVDSPSVESDSAKGSDDNFSPHVNADDEGPFALLNNNLPIYMNCPHCKSSGKDDNRKIKFASTVSQLQRIFVVTPPFPTVLATCPVIQFQETCLPSSIGNHEQRLQFSLGCLVVLPPESFITLRLPFVYGVKLDDGSLYPLKYLENGPEFTAWLKKGTALQVVSKDHVSNDIQLRSAPMV